jgi:hypothetical protein
LKHIFISYSSKDVEYAAKLESDLESNDYQVWRDKSELRGGDEWIEKIKTALNDAWAVVVIQSPNSEKSDWVEEELQYADNHKIPVIPLLLTGEPWFGFLRIQFVDARGKENDPIPEALYGALLSYAPPMPLETISKDLEASSPEERAKIVVHLEDMAHNLKSPKGIAARRLLDQLSQDNDKSVRKTAQNSIRRLPPPLEDTLPGGTNALASSTRIKLLSIAAGAVGVIIAISGVVMLGRLNQATTPTPAATMIPTTISTAISPATPVLSAVPTIAGATITFHEKFAGNALSAGWDIGKSVAVNDGRVTLTGHDDYDTFIARSGITTGEGVLVRFQFAPDSDPYLNIFNGDATNDPNYRAIIMSPNSAVSWSIVTATGDTFSELGKASLAPNNWYYLLYRIGKDGVIHSRLWDQERPDQALWQDERSPAPDWANRTWTFIATAKTGVLKIDQYAELQFATE